ncbi:MAG: DUF971 domain-containing protein [Proteobacteria bacterium]|nr:DUF971 domain-containing protein [Pseudomonadota bacterium]
MNHIPTEIKLNRQSRVLTVRFDDENVFELPCEFLRVHSPSAEVRGHGKGQEVLQLHKELVNISAIEPVGNYAVRLIFDDQHNTGLYSWPLLYDLGKNRIALWQKYLDHLSNDQIARQSQASDSLLTASNSDPMDTGQ